MTEQGRKLLASVLTPAQAGGSPQFQAVLDQIRVPRLGPGPPGKVPNEPDTGLITATDLTPGNTSDAEAAPDLIADEPDDIAVLGDSVYGTGELRAHLAKRRIEAVIKSPPLGSAVKGGFTLDDFDITTTEVSCPAGITITLTPTRTARFGTNCATSGLWSQCTTATKGRVIRLRPHYNLLAAARLFAATDDFAETYRQHRPLVERSIAWLVRGPNRRCRYRGLDRNRLRLAPRAAAVNLDQLTNLGLTHTTTGWASPEPGPRAPSEHDQNHRLLRRP